MSVSQYHGAKGYFQTGPPTTGNDTLRNQGECIEMGTGHRLAPGHIGGGHVDKLWIGYAYRVDAIGISPTQRKGIAELRQHAVYLHVGRGKIKEPLRWHLRGTQQEQDRPYIFQCLQCRLSVNV